MQVQDAEVRFRTAIDQIEASIKRRSESLALGQKLHTEVQEKLQKVETAKSELNSLACDRDKALVRNLQELQNVITGSGTQLNQDNENLKTITEDVTLLEHELHKLRELETATANSANIEKARTSYALSNISELHKFIAYRNAERKWELEEHSRQTSLSTLDEEISKQCSEQVATSVKVAEGKIRSQMVTAEINKLTAITTIDAAYRGRTEELRLISQRMHERQNTDLQKLSDSVDAKLENLRALATQEDKDLKSAQEDNEIKRKELEHVVKVRNEGSNERSRIVSLANRITKYNGRETAKGRIADLVEKVLQENRRGEQQKKAFLDNDVAEQLDIAKKTTVEVRATLAYMEYESGEHLFQNSDLYEETKSQFDSSLTDEQKRKFNGTGDLIAFIEKLSNVHRIRHRERTSTAATMRNKTRDHLRKIQEVRLEIQQQNNLRQGELKDAQEAKDKAQESYTAALTKHTNLAKVLRNLREIRGTLNRNLKTFDPVVVYSIVQGKQPARDLGFPQTDGVDSTRWKCAMVTQSVHEQVIMGRISRVSGQTRSTFIWPTLQMFMDVMPFAALGMARVENIEKAVGAAFGLKENGDFHSDVIVRTREIRTLLRSCERWLLNNGEEREALAALMTLTEDQQEELARRCNTNNILTPALKHYLHGIQALLGVWQEDSSEEIDWIRPGVWQEQRRELQQAALSRLRPINEAKINPRRQEATRDTDAELDRKGGVVARPGEAIEFEMDKGPTKRWLRHMRGVADLIQTALNQPQIDLKATELHLEKDENHISNSCLLSCHLDTLGAGGNVLYRAPTESSTGRAKILSAFSGQIPRNQENHLNVLNQDFYQMELQRAQTAYSIMVEAYHHALSFQSIPSYVQQIFTDKCAIWSSLGVPPDVLPWELRDVEVDYLSHTVSERAQAESTEQHSKKRVVDKPYNNSLPISDTDMDWIMLGTRHHDKHPTEAYQAYLKTRHGVVTDPSILCDSARISTQMPNNQKLLTLAGLNDLLQFHLKKGVLFTEAQRNALMVRAWARRKEVSEKLADVAEIIDFDHQPALNNLLKIFHRGYRTSFGGLSSRGPLHEEVSRLFGVLHNEGPGGIMKNRFWVSQNATDQRKYAFLAKQIHEHILQFFKEGSGLPEIELVVPDLEHVPKSIVTYENMRRTRKEFSSVSVQRDMWYILRFYAMLIVIEADKQKFHPSQIFTSHVRAFIDKYGSFTYEFLMESEHFTEEDEDARRVCVSIINSKITKNHQQQTEHTEWQNFMYHNPLPPSDDEDF
jgi:hypothetical protein